MKWTLNKWHAYRHTHIRRFNGVHVVVSAWIDCIFSLLRTTIPVCMCSCVLACVCMWNLFGFRFHTHTHFCQQHNYYFATPIQFIVFMCCFAFIADRTVNKALWVIFQFFNSKYVQKQFQFSNKCREQWIYQLIFSERNDRNEFRISEKSHQMLHCQRHIV